MALIVLNTATYTIDQIEAGSNPVDFTGTTSNYRFIRVLESSFPSFGTNPSSKLYPQKKEEK